MQISWKTLSTNLLKLGLAAALIYWLVQSDKFDLASLQDSLQPGYFALFLLLGLLNLLLNTWRWLLLLRKMGVESGLREAFPLNLIGIFFNYAMPGGVGGDLVKAYYIVRKNPRQRSAAASSVFLDRLIGLASMLLLALSALAWHHQRLFLHPALPVLAMGLLLLSLVFVLFFAIALSKRGLGFIKRQKLFQLFNLRGIPFKVLDSIHLLASQPRVLVDTMLLSLLSQTAFIILVYVLANQTLGVELSWSVVYFAIPLAMIVTALPISPAGIGVGQVAMYSFLEMMGVTDAQVGATAMSVIQIVLFAWGLLGCYFYLRMKLPKSLEAADA